MSLCTRPWSCRVLTPPVCWRQVWSVSEDTSLEGVTHQRLLGDQSLLSHARDQPQAQRHLVRLGWAVVSPEQTALSLDLLEQWDQAKARVCWCRFFKL